MCFPVNSAIFKEQLRTTAFVLSESRKYNATRNQQFEAKIRKLRDQQFEAKIRKLRNQQFEAKIRKLRNQQFEAKIRKLLTNTEPKLKRALLMMKPVGTEDLCST